MNFFVCISNTRRKIRYICDRHIVLKKLVKLAQPARVLLKLMGVGHALRVNTWKNKEDRATMCEEYRKFCDRHQEEFQRLSALFEDDFSRQTLKQVIACRKTYDIDLLNGVVVTPQYFQKDIFGPVKDEVFVDGGAYIGDTIESFINDFASGGVYKKIYAWEADRKNVPLLKKFAEKRDNIVCVPCGLWSEKTTLLFRSEENTRTSSIIGEGGAATQSIPVDSIDNVCSGDKVTFIKMDIEGSELAALKGAVNVIKRDKPRLAICVYHKPEDMYEIPFWIKQVVPEYKLYLRHHAESVSETVIYATL